MQCFVFQSRPHNKHQGKRIGFNHIYCFENLSLRIFDSGNNFLYATMLFEVMHLRVKLGDFERAEPAQNPPYSYQLRMP